MLTFSLGSNRLCDGVSRRNFLQVGGLAALGLTLPEVLASRAAAKLSPSADVNCILIWTRGGTSHHDTFDPKPEAPVSVRGEFGAISTSVPGVKFAEVVPNMARSLHRFGLLRGWNPRNGSHGHADQYVMSGRKFNPALAYPTYGSVVSYYKGYRSALPPFIQLGTNIDRRFGGGTAGVLGLEHNPFEVDADPNAEVFTVRDISLPRSVSEQRLQRRRRMLERFDAFRKQVETQPREFEALDEYVQTALKMITAPETRKAFEIHKEDPKLRDRYGRNRFGQSCLLARRLIEAGVRFVTVTDGSWDTHQNNFASLKTRLLPRVDQAFPTLLEDLQERGLLETTLVLWLTDFGRTPKVNSASGRDHWANAGFAIMAGAGVPGGSVIGATDDEGGQVVRDEYFTEDIAVTVYHKLGIPEDLVVQSPDGRPVRLVEGKPIREWM